MTPTYQIYHIVGTVVSGYDVYTDFVVVAESEDAARCTHPKGYVWIDDCWMHTTDGQNWFAPMTDTWYETPYTVNCYHIGTALPGTGPGIVCTSFNAG